MRPRRLALAALLGSLGTGALPAMAQDSTRAIPDSASFFATEAPITVTLTANFKALIADDDTNPAWRHGLLSWTDGTGRVDTVSIRVRPRGVWRRKHCHMPPLRLDLPRGRLAGTALAGLNRPKLVNFCRDSRRAEEYILQELQLYRVYHALTPLSHRARLLRMTYADSGSGRERTTRWAFVIEEEDALARRIGATELAAGINVDPAWLEARTRTLLGLFQHLIGNHDWSITGLHNIEVFQRDSTMYPVAYDFDYAGAVNAYYALPPRQVPVRRVRERWFRGDCVPPNILAEVMAHFRERRPAIRALYLDPVGRLLGEGTVQSTLDYFDEFYESIDDPRRVQREIVARCGMQ